MFSPLNPRIKLQDWNGLRVWMIGATGGIGSALSIELARLGACLTLSARNTAELVNLQSQCDNSLIVPFDISDSMALQKAVDKVSAEGVDLLIINAGTYHAARAHQLNNQGIDSLLNTNLLAPMRATSLIMPALLQSRNQKRPLQGIAFVASVAGYRGLPHALTYGSSKAGLIHFAESLWQDLQALKIGVWIINPGFVRSRLTDANDFYMPALITPQVATDAMIKGFSSGKFEMHFPRRFTFFMKFLRILPLSWYLRLTRRLAPPLSSTDFTSTRSTT